MTRLGLSADEMLLTTRAVRKRLDFDRPVPESLLRECARFAVQAPTSSNAQSWHFVFVTERPKVEALAAIYKRGSDLNRAGSSRPLARGRSATPPGEHSRPESSTRGFTWRRTCTAARQC